MEGPASEAYASSLRVESGQEKSVYDQSNQSSEEKHRRSKCRNQRCN